MITAESLRNKANTEAPNKIVEELLPIFELAASQGKGSWRWNYPHYLAAVCRKEVFKSLEGLGFKLRFEWDKDFPDDYDLASMFISWE